MTPMTALLAARAALAAGLALSSVAFSANEAAATSLAVKMACASDYYSYCSQHSPSSPGVRQCMRANGSKLSKGCISALVAAGEVAKSEVERKVASK
ncbi:MAG: hypothetical protein WC807_03205 [Hyphomicrobium sp.]